MVETVERIPFTKEAWEDPEGRTRLIENRFAVYGDARGGIVQSLRLFLALLDVHHKPVREHDERAALLAEQIAICRKMDGKAAFLATAFHDTGKLFQSGDLFTGRNITPEEYAHIKEHAVDGFEALRKLHPFSAVCAGLHHQMQQKGYGITRDDVPKEWSVATFKKALEIAAIAAVVDFIDAYMHRTSRILDGSDKKTQDLRGMLYEKYPNDMETIDIALLLVG